MREEEYKNVIVILLILTLLFLSFLIIKPIFVAISGGLILSYIFSPLYHKLNKYIKSKNISALIIVFGILVVILIPVFMVIPIIARQFLEMYQILQVLDLSELVKKVFPSIFQSPTAAAEITAITSSFTSNIANLLFNGFKNLFFNLPSLILQLAVGLFTFFFFMRDGERIREFISAISPFNKETNRKFYEKFQHIADSIIFGQIIVGICQGVAAGIGYFLFGVHNALTFTLISIICGAIPILGAWIVWVPIDIYLFASGETTHALFLLIYGLFIINWVDNLVRIVVVTKMSKMNSAIVLIGMVGGLYVFGILGLILGPLILAYLLLFIEFYKEKKLDSLFIMQEIIKKPEEVIL